jgi:hypothetical protein
MAMKWNEIVFQKKNEQRTLEKRKAKKSRKKTLSFIGRNLDRKSTTGKGHGVASPGRRSKGRSRHIALINPRN